MGLSPSKWHQSLADAVENEDDAHRVEAALQAPESQSGDVCAQYDSTPMTLQFSTTIYRRTSPTDLYDGDVH
jgi:hypothetical protein